MHELIDNVIKLSEINMHGKYISNTENQNVESLDEDANKENELTAPMHDNDKSTNHERRIQNILKEPQENRQTLVENIQTPIIYSEMVTSTGHPTQIKGGKPSSFYESYYTKINNGNLRSMKREKGIGTKKIKINSSHSQVARMKSGDLEGVAAVKGSVLLQNHRLQRNEMESTTPLKGERHLWLLSKCKRISLSQNSQQEH